MLKRRLLADLRAALRRHPAVALLGARQVGKTTLARALAAEQGDAVWLDLERESDRARLSEPELFLPTVRDRLVVLDEVQAVPQIFAALRPEIDADRRAGRFLLLGSASGELLRQSAESLAGRIAFLELPPLTIDEVGPAPSRIQSLWVRGGMPPSFLAADEAASFDWRLNFAETFVTRDLPQFGLRLPGAALLRFWRMLAHLHAQPFNASQLGLSLGGLAHTTVGRYLDVLVDTLLVRRLEPHHVNLGKRLVKAPRVYLRDSGLLHALLGIADVAALQAHPAAGPSWEGFAIEQIAAVAPRGAALGYYRTAAGAELDLVVDAPRRRLAFEIKLSAAPRPTRGFWQALEDVQPQHAYVVAPVIDDYPLARDVTVIGPQRIAALLAG